MKLSMKKEVEVEAKTLRIYCKVVDNFTASLLDKEGETLKEYDGYVPSFMPEEHYGDYLILNIDIDTGQVTNWQKPTKEQIEEFIASEES